MSEQQSYNKANTWNAPRAMRYLASRLLREWQDAIESDPALRRYRIMVKRYEKEFEATVREFDKEHGESIGDARCGNAAKLREFAELVSHMNEDGYWNGSASICALVGKAKDALAAPQRNCDKVKDHSDAIGKFEKWMGFSPKTADEQDAFFKEHWFEFAMWLIDMNESEVAK